MKGLGRKASLLAIAALIATALVGSAYTLWSENLAVDATLTTGTLDGKIHCGNAADNDEIPSLWGALGAHAYYPPPVPLKDIGDMISSVPADPSYHTWVLTVSNVYPGYAFDCEFELFNNGTVPWHIETEVIQVDAPAPQSDFSSQCGGAHTGLCWAGTYPTSPTSWQNPASSPIFVQAKDYRGCQVHEVGPQGSFFVGINQSALESQTYRIVLKFQVNQWNESQWSDCNSSGPIPRT